MADERSLASAIAMYAAHMGTLPANLEDLTRPSTNARGESSGAFLAAVPSPPEGTNGPYRYERLANGEFRITAPVLHGEVHVLDSKDGQTVMPAR